MSGASLRYDRTAIIAANPLLTYCRERGWALRRDGPRWKCLCPLHEERTPSFSFDSEKNLFHCFGCGAGGSVIDLHVALRGCDVGQAMAELATNCAGKVAAIPGAAPSRSAAKYDPFVEKVRQRRSWPAFETPGFAEIAAIAALRDLSAEGIAVAAERGLLFCTTWHGQRAWVVTDSARVNAQVRRMDGGLWEKKDSKAWTLPGSVGGWPVGLHEAAAFLSIAPVEGGPDLLAAFHLAWCETSTPETLALGKGVDVLGNLGVVAIFGAKTRITDAALPLFVDKRVRIFAHDDRAGYGGAATWAATLKAAGAAVDSFGFTGFLQGNGCPVDDLNDFARIDPDQWESERSLVESAFAFVPANPPPL